ncbi:MAG: hypothetical protein AB1430_05325 [Pseudomonadota bacterium]
MKTLATLAALAVALPAWAARPANLAGTTWSVQINRSTEQLVITHQGGAGTAGGVNCLALIGTIGPAPVRGYYCGATGEVHLRHNNMHTGATVRVFDARVSDEVLGQPLYMGGTVSVDDAAFGELGTYNFSGVRR